MKRILIFILAAVLVVSFAAGCSAKETEAVPSASPEAAATPEPTPEPTAEPLPIIGVSLAYESVFNTAFTEKATELAKSAGYDLKVLIAEGDAEKQLSDIETLVADDAKAIILEPANIDALMYTLDDCQVAGIKVINILEPANGIVDCLIAPDYSEIGKKAARLLDEAAREKKIEKHNAYLLEGAVDSFTMQLIHDGFITQAEELDHLTAAGAAHFSADEVTALTNLKKTETDAANAIFAQKSEMAKAFLNSYTSEGAHSIVSVGGDKELLELVKNKRLYASVFYGPKELAEKAMEQAIACANSDSYDPPEYIELSLGVASESTVDNYISQEGNYAEPVQS